MYFVSDEKIETNLIESSDEIQEELDNKSNLIKNLSYEVKFDDNTQYIITADLSEIKYENDIEIVEMQQVLAKIINDEKVSLIITGDKAFFNNSNFNTSFRENVKVEYTENVIFSDKLDLNFLENLVVIYENVVYEGAYGNVNTDNVIINLITKNVEIFMNDPKNKIKVKSELK
mgnify:CR=1 FL=1|tara:strand:+ start:161 stop:682 length:522 start_codon:yes stop_codon:yes gene_type:complete